MSNAFEGTLQRAYQLAAGMNHELVTLEHMLASLLETETIQKLVTKTGGNLDALVRATSQWLGDDTKHVIVRTATFQPRHTSLLATTIKKAKTQSMFSGRQEPGVIDIWMAMYGIADSPASFFIDKHGPTKERVLEYVNSEGSGANDMDSKQALEILATYCINLNNKALNGRIDPLIGREREVEQICQIMARRNKHNVIMTGDPGVGKTVIVEGLARRITEGDVPDMLLGHTIWSLDVATLVAGTKFRGDFEDRMKQIIAAFTAMPEAIMFIDEIHMIMGAGSGGGGNGSIDAANMLKPALSRGDIRCIGSTTQEEYRKHFEKDRALTRRFQKVDIFEPSIEDSKRILHGIARYYEQHHELQFTPEALDAAVELTARHQHDKFLPDKAIDIIDSAAAWQRIRPEALRLTLLTVAEIEAEVSRVARVPVTTVKSQEADRLAQLESDLKQVIFGQDDAIDGVVSSIYMSRSGLRDSDKTVGSFLFSGPSGVGKTEVAKQLARSLGVHFARFDMSEYQERHTVSRFIGSPPGYVGYGDGAAGNGLLINQLETHPHCVLLFDEIEKAHPDVYNIFLAMMDAGTVTSSQGKTASAKHAIVIFTSNLGAADMERELIGFTKSETRDEDTQAINRFFTPEFRNRLDAIVKFNKLSKDNMGMIVDKFLDQLRAMAKIRDVEIVCDAAARGWLIDKGFDPKMGARPLARVIADHIKKPLSKEMLFGKLQRGGAVMITAKEGKLEFEYMSRPDLPDEPLLLSDGEIAGEIA